MKHHIIVKFKKDSPELSEMLPRIKNIFAGVMEVPGVNGVEILNNCVDRANRYDLMIVIEMDRSSLEDYDNCDAHHLWKNEFSEHIESKAIFDCE